MNLKHTSYKTFQKYFEVQVQIGIGDVTKKALISKLILKVLRYTKFK